MCGRFSQVLSPKQIEEAFGPVTVSEELAPNYNVAPTQQAAVLTNREPTQLQLFEWGLVPFWSKDGKNNARMINARAEGIFDKPAFRKAIRERRCLVPADSFYEWKRIGKSKIPYRILPADVRRPVLVFAGIWEFWRNPADPEQSKLSFSIITTAPNKEMRPVHDRMPLVLAKAEQQEAWLYAENEEEISQLLQPATDDTLRLYTVSQQVNSVRNNGASLHDPEEMRGTLDL